jgi:hypothetical protein
MTIAAVTQLVRSRDTPKWLPIAGAALPPLRFLLFVISYGVNVPIWDDFNLIPLLDKFQHGQLSFTDLWAQHNENRVFFPNLIWVAASLFVHENLKVIMIFDAAAMIGSGVIFYLVWRRTGGSAWVAVPASFFYFTLLQHEDALSAFQLAWYLISLSFAVIVFALDRERIGAATLIIAGIAAIVASFSSLQGLFCWPAGAIFLMDRSRRNVLAGWLGAGAIATIVYFVGFDFHQTGSVVDVGAPINPLSGFVFPFITLGGLFTGNSLGNDAALELAGVLGFALLAPAIVVATMAIRIDPLERVKRLPFALLVFGVLFLLAIAFGRSQTLEGAVASRYTLFSAYIPIATLALLSVLWNDGRTAMLRYLAGAFGMLVAVSIVSEVLIGNSIGRYAVAEHKRDVELFTQAASEPDEDLKHLWCCPSLIRDYASLARRDQIMSFADHNASP